MPFDILISSFPYLLKGAVITFWLAVVTIVAGSALGSVLGVLSVFAPASVKAAITAYVFVIRGIPVLVLMFLTYYALPAMGILIGDYVTVSGALIVYCAAYVTEIVRGAILAVSRTQIEAAKGLGMRRLQYMRLVIFPQAIRLSIPPYLNNSIVMVKSTAYVSVVGIWELSYAAREVAERTLAPFQVFFGAMILYFLVCYPMSIWAAHLEKRTKFEE